MKRIADSLVQRIIDSADIVEVISSYVKLEKKGSRYVGLCPFHSERSPSFSVDRDKGVFFCFGCQVGGNVISFLREYEKYDFIEAVEDLAARQGITIEYVEQAGQAGPALGERESLLELYDRVSKTFHWLLLQNTQGQNALAYLKKRGLSDASISEFKLGYSPADKNWLWNFLSSKGYSAEFLRKSGLFGGSNKDYPLFTDRVLFPISTLRDKIVAFGGRLLNGTGPKYINSPDTIIFHKQDNLFAINHALAAIKAQNCALICEGYMDVIAFHNAGIKIAVAPLGTAFTEKQARLLRRFAGTLILAFDSDEAGQAAAEKACLIAARLDFQIRIFSLAASQYKDAAELVEKEGVEKLQQSLEQTLSSEEFLVRRHQHLFEQGGAGHQEALHALGPYIEALGSPLKREHFFQFLVPYFKTDRLHLEDEYKAFRAKNKLSSDDEAPPSTVSPQRPRSFKKTAELSFMLAVAVNAEAFFAQKVRGVITPRDFQDERAKEIFLALEEQYRQEQSGLDSLDNFIQDRELKSLIFETAARGEYSQNPEALIDQYLHTLHRKKLLAQREQIRRQITAYHDQPESPELYSLLSELTSIDSELRE